MAPKDELLSEYLRQQKPDDAEEEEEPSWRDKPLHGMYHRQIEEVADIKKSYQWLEKAGLKDSTEALIMAAQEQALSTRSIKAGIYHTRHHQSSNSHIKIQAHLKNIYLKNQSQLILLCQEH